MPQPATGHNAQHDRVINRSNHTNEGQRRGRTLRVMCVCNAVCHYTPGNQLISQRTQSGLRKITDQTTAPTYISTIKPGQEVMPTVYSCVATTFWSPFGVMFNATLLLAS